MQSAASTRLLPSGGAAFCGYNHTGTYVASSFLMATDAQGNSPCNDSSSTTTAVDLDMPVADGGISASPCTFTYSALTPAVADITIDHLNTCTSIGVPETAAVNGPAITVFPNPATDVVRIALAGMSSPDTKMVLVDPCGKVVRTLPVNGRGSILLERNALPSGLYLVRLSGSNAGATAARLMFE